MPFLELTLYDPSGGAKRRILLDSAQIESVREEADASFGLHNKPASGHTYLEIRTRSGATHPVAERYETLRDRLLAAGTAPEPAKAQSRLL